MNEQKLANYIELIDLLKTRPKSERQRVLRERMTLLNSDFLEDLSEIFSVMGNSESTAQGFSSLADCLQEFPVGSRMINLEIAINCYELSSRVYIEKSLSKSWARNQLCLAIAYKNRAKGDKSDNIEQAINCYELSLEVYTKSSFPQDWALTQMNLAIAYKNRIKGDASDNIERAINYYELSLEVYTKDSFPQDWARTQANYAVAYGNRIEGDKSDNLERSIACCKSALEIYNETNSPRNWILTQMNLAIAYENRIVGDKSNNIELAIKCYELALKVCTETDFPQDWALIQINLAIAYNNGIRGDEYSNIEMAIKCYELALKVCTKTDFPQDWALVQMNLANTYVKRIKGNKSDNVEQAFKYYRDSLKVRTETALPQECLDTARELGFLHFTQGHWQLAINAYSTAINALENLRGEANADRKQNILDNYIDIYENLIQAAINTDQLKLALTTIERIRSKRLIELMATRDLYHDDTVPDDIITLLTKINNFYQQINQTRPEADQTKSLSITHTARTSIELQQITTEILDLQQQLQQALNELAAKDPVAAGFAKVDPIPLDQLQKLVTTHSALLSFYTTDNNTLIFILRHNMPPQLFTCPGQGSNNLQTWIKTNLLHKFANVPATLADAEQQKLPIHRCQPWQNRPPAKVSANHLFRCRAKLIIVNSCNQIKSQSKPSSSVPIS